MRKTAPKIHASTQKFTEIKDIVGTVVVLEYGYACSIIEVIANNFSLLSKKEQDSKIFSYASLLNSLTFPIQILVRNKREDITSYLKELVQHEQSTQNPLLAKHIRLYREFVQQMVRVNVVLNKKFYIIVSYSSLEAGVTGARQAVKKGTSEVEAFAETAQKSLQIKLDSLHAQVRKFAISARTLEKDELIKLFYDIYNQQVIEMGQIEDDTTTPIIRMAK